MFQGQSTISKHWFDPDIEWFEENFIKREPQFYKKLFQTNIEGQSVITYPIFPIPLGNAKETGESEYYLQAPLVTYHQTASDSYRFSSLAYEFTASG